MKNILRLLACSFLMTATFSCSSDDNSGGSSTTLPIASDDEATYPATESKTIDVVANDTNGTAVIRTTVSFTSSTATDTSGNGNADTLIAINEGVWTVNATSGDITFTPEMNYVGSPNPINYRVADAAGNTDTAMVTLTVEDQYIPFATSNYWVYDVTDDNGTLRDSLHIAGMINTNGFNYFDFDATVPATGLATRMYSENLHRKNNDEHLVYGTIDVGALLDNIITLNINLNDEVLMHETAAVGTNLINISDTVTQTIQSIPMTINYTLSNEINNISNSLTVNSQTFDGIIETKMALNVEVIAMIDILGTQVPVTVMLPQDVLVTFNSYANNVGLVQSETDISYVLEDIPGITFPFPSSMTQHVSQVIVHYDVSN